MASPDWIVANLATERKAALNRIKEICDKVMHPELPLDYVKAALQPHYRVEALEQAIFEIERIAKSV